MIAHSRDSSQLLTTNAKNFFLHYVHYILQTLSMPEHNCGKFLELNKLLVIQLVQYRQEVT